MNGLKFHSTLVILFLTSMTWAQLMDTFSDGDFALNPPWSGDQSKFVVNSGKLKLQAPAVAETAFLSSSSQSIHEASWEFYLQMDFNPSSTNYAKIYLVSDQSNLNQSLNGYFVRAGNTSREVGLYRQNGTIETKIIDGLDDRLNISLVKLRIKVTRSGTGLWQLFSDVGPTGLYVLEGSIVDNAILVSSYFGIQCTYTSTRSDKFWFDDFTVTGIPVPDTTPPAVQTATALGAKQINVQFSEPLESQSAMEPSNYLLVGIGQPAAAVLQADQKTVQLNFIRAMTNGLTYPLQISKVKDLKENGILQETVSVLYFQAVGSRSKDIIISEIFPDPSPQIGLPAAEFIEIYNRSQNPFSLSGWRISDGSSNGILPSQIILPGEYRIITALSSSGLFSSYGTALGVINFPTLNNDSDHIILKNEENLTIDSVSYNLDWYHDEDKQEGGWTLELIDPNNPCGEEDNWTASESAIGGTPGKQNSVFASKPDRTVPVLISAFPESPYSMALTFNEKLDRLSLAPENFNIQPPLKISKARFSDQGLRTIIIELSQELSVRTTYSVTIANVRDCNGNLLEDISLGFGLPEKSDSLDVIVNEILFNPRTGGVDFVEVYNPSPKFLNLRNWKLSNYVNAIPINISMLFSEDILLTPKGFSVFTSDPHIVKSQYPQSLDKNLFRTSMPGFPDDAGSVAIINESGKILDAFAYDKDWHSEFIKNDDGVSLERIEQLGATHEKNNWTSASAQAGFATPGFQNSQGRVGNDVKEGDVIIIPEVFSPDSGNNDFVQIQYHFNHGGWVASVKIYDPQGHPLKNLVNNETLSTEGFFRWDGDRDDGSKARMGYYLIWFEAYDADGHVRTFRKRVIVSGR